ncbi:hypothetical protein OK006_11043 [Actinobacteria bacterium OK006]|nr:hypothetical protein OK006_11043 [Actinobacteria bacterium OK006]
MREQTALQHQIDTLAALLRNGGLKELLDLLFGVCQGAGTHIGFHRTTRLVAQCNPSKPRLAPRETPTSRIRKTNGQKFRRRAPYDLPRCVSQKQPGTTAPRGDDALRVHSRGSHLRPLGSAIQGGAIDTHRSLPASAPSPA